jgi:hypothetical protein
MMRKNVGAGLAPAQWIEYDRKRIFDVILRVGEAGRKRCFYPSAWNVENFIYLCIRNISKDQYKYVGRYRF